MKEFKKIAHLTSAHDRYDTRIFLKMCKTLSLSGFNVFFVVADGKGNENSSGVSIVDVGENKGGRISRMTKVVNKVYAAAKEIDADIYHLHDPELMRIGNKLKNDGKIVIFDAHEDLPKQILSKPYLNPIFRNFFSKLFTIYERYSCRKYDQIISATSAIRNKFKKSNISSVVINNYPILGELRIENAWKDKKNEVIYLGGISSIRGIRQLVNAMEHIDSVILNLVGEFSDKKLEAEVRDYLGWKNVEFHGFKNRNDVSKIMANSIAGVVTFLPAPNHVDSQPNKMFEYMSSGIPIIVSNFSSWTKLINDVKCGICVDPENPEEISQAIKYLAKNKQEAEKMGDRGLSAIKNEYNWSIESKKLLELYGSLLI